MAKHAKSCVGGVRVTTAVLDNPIESILAVGMGKGARRWGYVYRRLHLVRRSHARPGDDDGVHRSGEPADSHLLRDGAGVLDGKSNAKGLGHKVGMGHQDAHLVHRDAAANEGGGGVVVRGKQVRSVLKGGCASIKT
jgi:hypothetical protein